MTTVDTLRRAASLMRERVEAIPAEGLSDWWFDADASDLMHMRKSDRVQIATFGHPAVALAVADMLIRAADAWDAYAVSAEREAIRKTYCEALEVARAYLGESA